MTSSKQRAANKLNALKSSGPKSGDGKRRSSANATKHALSLPVNEHFFAKEIILIAALVRADCDSDSQAMELAKRIIDYERHEAFLMSQSGLNFHDEVKAWAQSPQRMALSGLSQSLSLIHISEPTRH